MNENTKVILPFFNKSVSFPANPNKLKFTTGSFKKISCTDSQAKELVRVLKHIRTHCPSVTHDLCMIRLIHRDICRNTKQHYRTVQHFLSKHVEPTMAFEGPVYQVRNRRNGVTNLARSLRHCL